MKTRHPLRSGTTHRPASRRVGLLRVCSVAGMLVLGAPLAGCGQDIPAENDAVASQRSAVATAWAAWVAYGVGAQVTYNGRLYQCLQAHTSQPGWEPPAVPALWKDLGSSGGGDTIAPTVNASANSTQFTSAGTLNLTATASDNVGVTRVEILENGTLVSSSSTYSRSFSGSAQNGTYTYTVRAYDAAGNVGSRTLTVTVNIPSTGDTVAPTVSASANSTLFTAAGTLNLTSSATDNVGVTRVEILENGTLVSSSSTYSRSFSSSTQNGTYTYTVKAYDAAGNVGSRTLTVTVNIGGTPPPPGGRMYVGYASSWNTSIYDLTTTNIPSYYTHLNLAFVRPNTTYRKGSYEFDQAVAGFEFTEGATTYSGQKKFTAAQSQALINNISALRARGTQVWISVGGWSYSQGSQWASFDAARVVDLAQDLGASGVDIDWESSGSSCNKLTAEQFSCTKDAEIAQIITSLYNTIQSRGLSLGISIAGWSTGAYYVKGTPFEEGKVQWGSPFGGTMYSVVKNHGSKLHHINLMSYDGGDYYDPREGYESYRAIYSGPIAMGLEIAPEGSGGAVLKLNAEPGTVYDAEMLTGQNNMATKYYNVETLATYIKNKGRATDGMMVWQIWKERVYAPAPAGAAGVNSTGQLVCQILGLVSNCNQSVPNLPKY
ncbi:MAG TPA: Ig-like domain-containing protein [Archangium sp.]|nr:Ig-like domain-containing protein [Archangium sp.]HYO59464.1 Ig-like domain-containing protein [Archangium sp.]